MTNPKYVRAAKALREELGVEGVVIVAWSRGSMPHAAGAGTPGQALLADDMAAHLVSSVVPTFLLKRNWGEGPTTKSRKLARREGAE